MTESNTLINALIGALVTGILAWFVPLAPLVGGAATAYLERADKNTGVRTGALSGAIALLPLALVGVGIVAFVGLFTFDPVGTTISVLAVGFALLAGVLYVVGLSALGGYLGAYLATEYASPKSETRV
jgi:hypothetical protein